MADFETKLQWLSQRGNPVGAEEMIERIEADLAGDPLVVVSNRREGTVMTKTQDSPTTQAPKYRGPTWAVAAFVAVVALAVLYLAFDRDEAPVADTTLPPPTTVAPETPTTLASDAEATANLAVIEAGVAAFYSGNADRAAELFELKDRSDDEIRTDSAYQAAVDGRLTLNCMEQGTSGVFCRTPYHNALTDAIGFVDRGDSGHVVVEDGVITEFGFPEHSFIVAGIGTFLATEGRFDGYEHCSFGPFPESCATIQLDNLDAWVEWERTSEPATIVESALASWYGGDCPTARHLNSLSAEECAAGSDPTNQMIEYESILEAEVSVDGCESVTSNDPEFEGLSCEVSYSNTMNAAVGRPPAVTVKHFDVWLIASQDGFDGPWHSADYPEDTELRESFTRFAESGELSEEYAAAGCASARTPECANLIMANLDEWAAWYETNS